MAGGPQVSGRGGLRSALIAAGLVVAVAATFANGLHNEFVFEDYPLIVENEAVRTPLAEGASLAAYRPLGTLSYRIDHALGAMDPWVFHLSSLVYHALTVLLVVAVLRATGASPWAAGAGALLFAVHPLQTDAVTYVSGRSEVLCGLFFAAGFLAYLAHREHGGVATLAIASAACVLAVLAAETALVLPLVMLIYARWSGRASRPGRGRPGSIALAAVVGVLAFAGVYGGSFLRAMGESPWHGGSPGANFATVARVWAHYLGLLLWPAQLSADYGYRAFPVSPGPFDARAIASVALLALLALPAWRSWRRGGLAGFGAAWWAVTLLPVSHVVPQVELLAERNLYVPMIGAAMVAAGLVDALAAWAPRRRQVLVAAVVVVACLAATRTVVRNRDWRDKLSLWSATVAVVPECARARYNLGQAYFERVRPAEAEREWLAADAITPGNLAVNTALATLYYQLARHELATARVEAAMSLAPTDPQVKALAGWIALDSGHPERAIEHFDAALAEMPGDQGVQLGRARAAQALAPSDNRILPLKQGRGPG